MKVLFITNIPAPYRIDFFNELGKYVELTVVFEAKHADNQGIKFNWNLEEISNFKPIFLNEGNINEKKIDWKIFKYIKKGYYDEIVATNYAYLTEMAAIIYMKILGIPYYMETDGGLIREENIIKKLYKKMLVSGAKGYFSPSKSSDDYLVYYGARRNKIFRYPFTSLKERDITKKVLTSEQKKSYKERLGITEEKVVLAIGQFIPRKGFDLLIQAAQDLDHSIGIYIVGGEATREYLKLKNSFSCPHVHFEGFKKKDELVNYFKAADIFVLPTREDIWGLVINEAMSYGLPIITTNKCVAGLELVSKENGEIIESNSVDDLKNSIKKLLSQKDEIELMSNNSLKKIEEYTVEKMVKAHLEIFF